MGANLKYYFSDVGLRNARLNFRQQEPTHIMENIVYNELLVRGYNVDVGIVDVMAKNVDSKRVRKQLEVDFVVNQGSQRYYIQVAYDMDFFHRKTACLRNLYIFLYWHLPLLPENHVVHYQKAQALRDPLHILL